MRGPVALPHRVLILGLGYSGLAIARQLQRHGCTVDGTVRDRGDRGADGVACHRLVAGHPLDEALLAAIAQAEAVLCTVPPDAEGDPALRRVRPLLAASTSLRWLGYLSSTGVYADRAGGWVDECAEADARTPSALQRLLAEQQWCQLATEVSARCAVFRLPGLYGRGRNALVQLAEGRARQVIRPGLVFNRLHVEDLAGVVVAALQGTEQTALYLPADDLPAPPQDVLAHAAQLGGHAMPPPQSWEDPSLSPALRRFYSSRKRIDSRGTRERLQWQPRFPSYREGLQDAWDHGDGR